MPFLLAGLLFLISIGSPAFLDAAYLIKLKNGKEFITGRYWRDGNQVKFDTYGGVFGVDRSLVASIEESGKPVKLEPATQPPPEEKRQTEPPAEKKEGDKATAPAETKAKDKPEDDPIAKEFQALKERFESLTTMTAAEVAELAKELTGLRRKIEAARKVNDYFGEFREIQEMLNALEAALKSKR